MGSTIPDRAGDGRKQRPHLSPRQARQALAGPEVAGIDVSHYQGDIDWSAVAGDGVEFTYIKATEGTTYTDPKFASNYDGSRAAGLIRGAYHFALPDRSSGAAQARFFVNNGGGWRADGQTLPPALDIEFNPYGPKCYGLSPQEMRAWIADFSSTVKKLSGRFPAIYTTTSWWKACTGNHGGFADTNPLWVARWTSSGGPGPLPAGWPAPTLWQYTNRGNVAGISGAVDRNVFSNSAGRLRALARCTNTDPC